MVDVKDIIQSFEEKVKALKNLEQDVSNLEKKGKNLETDIASLTQQINELTDKRNGLSKYLAAKVEEATAVGMAKVKDLEEGLVAQKETLSRESASVSALKSELNSKIASNDKLQVNLLNSIKETEILHKEITTVKDRLLKVIQVIKENL